MKFYTYGKENNPVIVMLPGSFCPSKALDYLYNDLKEDYCILTGDYNGHYGNSVFTTRQKEAGEIAAYLGEKNINSVRMIYGQSMGSEVGIELMHQLVQTGIHVDKAFFDGAPCIKLSKPYKAFMYFKFKTMIGMMKDKTIEEVMSWKFLKKFTNGDTESLRSLIAGCVEVAPYLTDQSIKAENECCYTFDYPAFSENEQQKMHFFYAKEEKAYKTCYKLLKTAYPNAKFKVVSGYGHMTYSVRNTEEYLQMLRKVCN